jgi:DNA-binding transcriptional MerR regulator
MTIGELARAGGVPISTLRFYERRGILTAPARSSSGYRSYDVDAVLRVRFLRRAQQLGFTLAECAAMLAWSRQGVRRGPIVRAGAAKLEEIDGRIADLRRVRRALAGLLAAPCIDLAAPCPIVAALAGSV